MTSKRYLPILMLTVGLAASLTPAFAQTGFGQTSQSSRQQAMSMQDQQFMIRAAQINLAEIMTNQLALQKSSNAQVRALATQMLQDHTRANADLTQIARSFGATLPLTPDARQQAMYTQLSALNGSAFDRAFTQHMSQAHQEAILTFRTESSQGQTPELRNYALTYLPGLETHLASVQQQMVAMQVPGQSGMATGMDSSGLQGATGIGQSGTTTNAWQTGMNQTSPSGAGTSNQIGWNDAGGSNLSSGTQTGNSTGGSATSTGSGSSGQTAYNTSDRTSQSQSQNGSTGAGEIESRSTVRGFW